MKKIIFLLLTTILFVSCDTNERNIKKTFSRLNSRETAAASKYVWPEDHKNLYVFEKRFLNNNKLLSIDIESINQIDINGNSAYKVNWACNNCNDELLAYFKSKNNLAYNNKIEDTVFVKTANGNNYITFDWGLNDNFVSDDIKLSNISAEKLNLRAGPGKKFKIIGQLQSGDELLIDDGYINSSWRKGLIFDEKSKVNHVYFSSKLSNSKEISFFTLDWANSLGVIVITMIAIVVILIVYPLLFAALFRAGGEGAMVFALILFFVLLVAVYFTYQIIETAVFELFIYNLPF